MTTYNWHHVVGFEETNLMGNVYFTNYLLWQGHCRERFLADHVPQIRTQLLSGETSFFTQRCECDYLAAPGFLALDRIEMRMSLVAFRGGRMTLGFEYAMEATPEVLVARGRQALACLTRKGESYVPSPFPASFVAALKPFAESPEIDAALDDTLRYLAGGGD
jgi:enediyne biosynthesis thioesterase